jgi:hypothetical protein
MAQVRDETFNPPYTPAAAPSISRQATLTDNSAVVTGLSQTSDLVVGMSVSAPGIYPGTRILSIDSATQITLSTPANILSVKWGETDTSNGEITEIRKLDAAQELMVGMVITGAGWIQPGTTVATIVSESAIIISQPATDLNQAYFTFTLPASQTLSFGGLTSIGKAVADIIADVDFYDTVTRSIRWDPAYLLQETSYAGSRVDALTDLCKASGGVAYFDGDGDFVFAQPPDPHAAPVWSVDAGDTGVLVSDDEALDRTGVCNGVLVRGRLDASSLPVEALVTDADPTSPTFWGGPFGRVLRIEESSAITTVDQAQAAAQAILDRSLGLSRSITLQAAPNPALEPGDVVAIVFDDGRVENHLVDAIRVGLEPGAAQELQTRTVWRPASALWAPLPSVRRDVYVGDAAWEVVRGLEQVSA